MELNRTTRLKLPDHPTLSQMRDQVTPSGSQLLNIDHAGVDGQISLIDAVQLGDFDAVRMILRDNARDVNKTDQVGCVNLAAE